MKAIVIDKHGGPEALDYREVPDPEIGPGEVLLQVKASGINPNGYWARVGVNNVRFPLPLIPGSDCAGVVLKVGEKVTSLQPGDEVVAYCGICCQKCYRCVNGEEHICEKGFRIWGFDAGSMWGAHAELVRLPEYNCVPKPKGTSWEEAASLPLTLVTAWHMLVTNARITANDVVLIRGAAGGLGVMAVQIAKLRGAVVVAVASTEEKREVALRLGADHVILRPRKNDNGAAAATREGSKAFLKQLKELTGQYYQRGVDVVFDHIGGETLMESIGALRHGGVMVTCGATSGYATQVELAPIFIQNKSILGSTLGTRAELIAALRSVERGQIRPFVSRVLPLTECAEAQETLRRGEAIGKVVLTR